MTKIKNIRHHKTGEIFAPRTHIKAVVDDNGNTLNALMEE